MAVHPGKVEEERPERIVPIEQLGEKPYNLLASYPRPTPESVKSRIDQLERLGVQSIVFGGSLLVDGVPILGKGCVGMVFEAIDSGGTRFAVKIRRTDADRSSMSREARLLKIANGLGVGPAYRGDTDDVLLMDLINGLTLPRWLPSIHGRGRKRLVKETLRTLLKQCYRLDGGRLDHGELSHAHKNVLVDRQGPVIVDFETASLERRPRNVTSMAQYLFIAGKVSRSINRILGLKDKDRTVMLEALRAYKKEPSNGSLARFLSTVGLSD